MLFILLIMLQCDANIERKVEDFIHVNHILHHKKGLPGRLDGLTVACARTLFEGLWKWRSLSVVKCKRRDS